MLIASQMGHGEVVTWLETLRSEGPPTTAALGSMALSDSAMASLPAEEARRGGGGSHSGGHNSVEKCTEEGTEEGGSSSSSSYGRG